MSVHYLDSASGLLFLEFVENVGLEKELKL